MVWQSAAGLFLAIFPRPDALVSASLDGLPNGLERCFLPLFLGVVRGVAGVGLKWIDGHICIDGQIGQPMIDLSFSAEVSLEACL